MASSILQDAMPPPSPDHPASAARFRPYASSKHTVTRGRYITSNDPRGYVPVYEYPLNGQWLMVDSDNGYVLWTGIWKALGNTKADIMKMVECQPELAPQLRRVRGGYLKIQGTWMPYEIALRLARRVAWPIREDLVPLFGPTFPSTCLSPDQPGYGQLASRRKSRRTTNPNLVLGAPAQPQQQEQHLQDHPKHTQSTALAGPSSAAQYETRPVHASHSVAPADVRAASAGGSLPFYLPRARPDQIPNSTQSSPYHPRIPYTAEASSAAYRHSYPQLQDHLVPQARNDPRAEVQIDTHTQTHAQSHLGSRYPLLLPASAQEYRNTPSYPQQSDRKNDHGSRQEHHRQQRYSPYPSPSDIHAPGHSHGHGLPQNPNPASHARPIENLASTSPRTPHTPFITHPLPYRTHDRELDGPIHLPPLSSLGPPLLPPPPIQTAFGGGPPNVILGPSNANSNATNGLPSSTTYSLPPISSLDSPGSGSGPDGSSAVLRRLRLDDEHLHLHRRDLDARAAALHRVAYSESGFTLPSPQELRRRRSISAPPLNAYGGGGASAGNASLPTALYDIEPERGGDTERGGGVNPSQSRGLRPRISIPQRDTDPQSFRNPNPYTPLSSVPYDHHTPQHEQPRAGSETHFPQLYSQPHPRSPLLTQPVYHGSGAPQWPTTTHPFPPPDSGPGPGPSYSNEIAARASGSSTHHTHASWAHPHHPFVPADNIERRAVPPTRMPTRPW